MAHFSHIDKMVRFLPLLVLVFCLGDAARGRGQFAIDDATLESAVKLHGEEARQRLLAWEKLIRENDSDTDEAKLEAVNVFFNRMQFVDDQQHWGKQDYWATPVEFLATGGGDCEDFALAKYFTLKAIGVKENKLNMTYVKALRLNQAHMVVTYFRQPGAEPLVLDNLVEEIVPATRRKDLLPVYSFNGSGLWLAKARGQGEKVGKSGRLHRWQDLLQRLPEGLN